jgi:histone deacetylase HOS3
MKKARGTATATAAARAPQRPPVPRIPPSYSVRSSAPKGKENTDLESLTSGMGRVTLGTERVTLRFPTSEEHDAREKALDEKQKAMKERQKAAEAAPKKTSKCIRIPSGTTMS